MQANLNFNISAYRVLLVLLHLSRRRSLQLSDIAWVLMLDAHVQKLFTLETLNTYLNTLRQGGCHIETQGPMLHLKRPFFSQAMTLGEITLIKRFRHKMPPFLLRHLKPFFAKLSWTCGLPNAAGEQHNDGFTATTGPTETVVEFELSGRLARNYRLYPNEVVIERNENTLLIQHVCFDTEALINRLLRYEHYCRVVTPTTIRQQLLARVNALIQCIQTEPLEPR
jgi:hypothetical protein